MSGPQLELFYFYSCPFCQFVLNQVKQLDIKVKHNDIYEDSANFERLRNDTGRTTVPCLYIDNKPMFESAEIIKWLQDNHQHLEKNGN